MPKCDALKGAGRRLVDPESRLLRASGSHGLRWWWSEREREAFGVASRKRASEDAECGAGPGGARELLLAV